MLLVRPRRIAGAAMHLVLETRIVRLDELTGPTAALGLGRARDAAVRAQRTWHRRSTGGTQTGTLDGSWSRQRPLG